MGISRIDSTYDTHSPEPVCAMDSPVETDIPLMQSHPLSRELHQKPEDNGEKILVRVEIGKRSESNYRSTMLMMITEANWIC